MLPLPFIIHPVSPCFALDEKMEGARRESQIERSFRKWRLAMTIDELEDMVLDELAEYVDMQTTALYAVYEAYPMILAEGDGEKCLRLAHVTSTLEASIKQKKDEIVHATETRIRKRIAAEESQIDEEGDKKASDKVPDTVENPTAGKRTMRKRVRKGDTGQEQTKQPAPDECWD